MSNDETIETKSEVSRAVDVYAVTGMMCDQLHSLRTIATAIDRHDEEIRALRFGIATNSKRIDALEAPAAPTSPPPQSGPPWAWTEERRAGIAPGATVEFSDTRGTALGIITLSSANVNVDGTVSGGLSLECFRARFADGEVERPALAYCNPATLRPPAKVEAAPAPACGHEIGYGVWCALPAGHTTHRDLTGGVSLASSSTETAPVTGEGEVAAIMAEYTMWTRTRDDCRLLDSVVRDALAKHRAEHAQEGVYAAHGQAVIDRDTARAEAEKLRGEVATLTARAEKAERDRDLQSAIADEFAQMVEAVEKAIMPRPVTRGGAS